MKQLILLLLLIILGCQESQDFQEELLTKAKAEIKESKVYNTYNGMNLLPVSSPIVRDCDECYRAGFIFDTNIDLPVEQVAVTVDFKGTNITNIHYQEKLNKTISNYKECVESGYNHDEKNCYTLNQKFTKPFCEDQCGDGYCDEVVCMGEGCPCPETKENCPIDCLK
ncbi:MAG: hypothetical protein ACLFP2_02305 [Candidatus Woesearchaeota archaeon]